MIVELSQAAALPFPRPFDALPAPSLGRVLMLAAFLATFIASVTSAGTGSAKCGSAGPAGRARGSRTAPCAFAVALFAAGCFTYYYSVSDETAVNLEHAWNAFHSGRFSMSRFENIDGTIEVVYYFLHAPFAGSLSRLVLANYTIGLACSLACTLLLYSAFRRLDASGRYTWVFLLVAFPLVRSYATGFGSAFFSFLLLLSATLMLDGKRKWGDAIALALPLVRPDGVLWSVALLAPARTGAAGETRRGLVMLALLGVSAAGYYGFFYAYYGHVSPTPVLNKTIALDGYLAMFSRHLLLREGYGFILTGGAIALAAGVLLCWKGSRSLAGPESTLIDRGTAVALLYCGYYWAGSATIGWYGNQEYRYFAPSLSFVVFAALYVCGRFPVGRGLVFLQATAVLVVIPFADSMAAGSPVDGNIWVNRQWAVRAGFIAEQVALPAGLSVATSEMNTFGLTISKIAVQDYWSYTDREVASSRTCSGDRVHWLPRQGGAADRFDLFWVYFTSKSDQDFYGAIERDLLEFHHFAKSGGYRLGEMPDVLEQYDVFLIRVHSGETVTFLVAKAKSALALSQLSRVGIGEVRRRDVDTGMVRAIWAAQAQRRYPC